MSEHTDNIMTLPDIKLYYKRLADTYGADSRACGYSDPIAQLVRFKCYTTHMSMKDASVLDVGCGTGDILHWLSEIDMYPSSYLGIDMLDEQIKSAKSLYEDRMLSVLHADTEVEFRQSLVDQIQENGFDVAIACSIFDVKQTDVPTTFALAKSTMTEMFERLGGDGVMGADFFSPYALDIQPFNAPIPPEWVFTWAKNNLSERVTLDFSYSPHNYAVIIFKGQNDFMKAWRSKGGWGRDLVGETSE